MWQQVEARYLPWRNYGDLEHPARGGFWQSQQHIYQHPFYYIDYALAGTCALQFWAKSLDDGSAAMADYVALCDRGGQASFLELVKSANLRSPFEAGVMTEIAGRAREFVGL
jgi:oligoendopeptidase F